MARPRAELSAILNSIESHCYFQPNSNTKLVFPCIVYRIKNIDIDRADNKIYKNHNVYEITHIYKSPSSEKRMTFLEGFDFISFDRPFINDGLYHDVFTLYF